MTTKSATVLVRMEPKVKKQAEEVFTDLGMTPSTAVNVFYRQVIKYGGFPFEITTEQPSIPNLDEMTTAEIKEMLEESTKEIKAGKTKSASEVFAKLHKEFGF